ncbi:uncharacterized protein LOC587887 isoform X2 [Strongylocentrotus purpuratus]|uniref:IGFBP N-terminal domain-containing protein n=1 Tax=Strongylocentrotus purpuratus TaxID=7668 RepID=A0A7M7PCC3_STRPU|nr:uncharacterized protein LOC587887 isoform X2 [Strongylocentrotus purpuratus]
MMSSKWFCVVMATVALFGRGDCLSCICHEDIYPLTPEEWRAQNCPVDVQCPAGSQVIWDICYCCKSECSKSEGDECGGEWGEVGTCGDGLECYIEEPDTSEYRPPIGNCVPLKPTAATASGGADVTVPSGDAGGATTTKPRTRMGCGKKQMALMGEEERMKCEEARKMRIQKRRERNGKRINNPRI